MHLFPGIAYGTKEYPEKIARRLRAVNIAAWSMASATLFFTILRFLDPRPEMLSRAFINLAATIVLASLPLLHRFGPLAAPLAPRKDHSTAVGTRIWNFWEVNREARRAMEQLGGWREVG